MAKKYRVTLTAEEREELQTLIATGKASARKLAHARVLLQADETEAAPGRTDEETATALNLSVRTNRACARTIRRARLGRRAVAETEYPSL